jgi:hypothetical protein
MREFKIGQYVYYVPRREEGRYVVMRLLPQAKGGLHCVWQWPRWFGQLWAGRFG